jgi:hypothetical protein
MVVASSARLIYGFDHGDDLYPTPVLISVVVSFLKTAGDVPPYGGYGIFSKTNMWI